MYPLVSIESQRSSKRMKNAKHAYESKKKTYYIYVLHILECGPGSA